MHGWGAFVRAAPAFAEAGHRLFVKEDGIAIGFLASVSPEGRPHLAPVCPIFCGEELYLSAGAHTPKVRDLREHGAYVLHAFLAPNDEELQIAGRAHEVTGADERAAVHAAIPFPAFGREDPIFRFDVERAFWVHWERVGTPETYPVRRRWTRARGVEEKA